MNNYNSYINKESFSLKDAEYKEFQKKLIPNIDPKRIIGIRTPNLRKFAKTLAKTEYKDIFLSSLPHFYYEENTIHSFLIGQEKDCHTAVKLLNKFLPFVDNWATCDSISPKCFSKEPQYVFENITICINDTHEYTVRFGILALMKFYLNENYRKSHLDLVAEIKSDFYYVNMMRAWYFATALCEHYTDVLEILENNSLDKFTHNKTIQKAIESYRITEKQKTYLKLLRR